MMRAVVADASRLDDVERFFADIKAETGQLDVLFASAGAGTLTEPLDEVTLDSFNETFGLNVRGTLFAAQKAVELMSNGGSIILNGSAAAEKAIPGSSVYAASKAALKAFARVWSAELAARSIRVNVLHPGPTGLEGRPQGVRDYLASLTTIGRLAQPNEIARPALFLATSDSSFVTGTELFVTGGMGQS
jgi:NAD(P)-dependent dehydrogenase (short-subunit alcohol dehydrogenase family)